MTSRSRSSYGEWVETLGAEQMVDLVKLRDFARHGVPEQLRGEVWVLLLGVLDPVRTSELTTARFRLKAYSAIPKSNDLVARLAMHAARNWHLQTWGSDSIEDRVRHATLPDEVIVELDTPSTGRDTTEAGVEREDRDEADGGGSSGGDSQAGSTFTDNPSPSNAPSTPFPPTQSSGSDSTSALFASDDVSSGHEPPPMHIFTRSLVSVFCAWLNKNPEIEQRWKALDESELRLLVAENVAGLAVFLSCLRLEAGAFWGWSMWQERLALAPPLPVRLASFMSLFRDTLPDLYATFEIEEFPTIEIASCWLSSMGTMLQLSDVHRLWDTYHSHPSIFALHDCVLLSILSLQNDVLEELDANEARHLLFHLPKLDMDRILASADRLFSAQDRKERVSS